MKTTIKLIKERWNGKETKVGRFLRIFVGYFLAICTIAGSALEYTHLIPEDWIPGELKYAIAIMAFIGWVAGKLTKVKEEDGPQQNNT